MQTRDALRRLSGGAINHQYGDGPLGAVADVLIEAFNAREAERLDQAEVRASMMGTGAMFKVLQQRFAAAQEASLYDASVPMVMRFDAHQVLLDASRALPGDRGLKLCAAHAKELWMREPDGVLAVGDVARMRAHWSREFPKSKVAQVIDNELPKVGFNTLPIDKLAQMAVDIRGRTQEELEQSYATVVCANGLDGSKPHQVKARGFLRGLVNLAAEPEGGFSVEAGGEAAADRALWRMAAFDDPILRAVGQALPPPPPPPVEGPMEDAALPEGGGGEMLEDEAGSSVEVASPITGEPIKLELELGSGEPGVPGEGGGEAPPVPDVTPEEVQGLAHFGQLTDFGEAGSPTDDGDVPSLEEGPGEVTTVIEDPTAPGQMLEVTIIPEGQGEDEENTPAVSLGMPLESTSGHISAGRQAKAPPGREEQVKELKKDPDIDNPFAVAWSSYDKSHDKEPKDKSAGRAFLVYAIKGGQRADQPLERFQAESMARALRHVAKSLGELGRTEYAVKAPPDQFQDRALIVLDASAGDHLYIVAEEKGSEFSPTVIEQQPAQVTLPGGGEDGTTVLMSDGGFAQPRSTRKVDVSPGASAVDRTDKVSSMSEARVLAFCERVLGFTPTNVEATLLEAQPVTVMAGREEILRLEVDDRGDLGLWRKGTRIKTASLDAIGSEVSDFLARAAAECQALGGAEPVGGPGVAPASYEVHPLFLVGCAQCGGIGEYLMPKEASAVKCGACGWDTPAPAVAVQLQARQAQAYPGYVVLADVPGEKTDLEINARRLMAAILQVAPMARGELNISAGRIEVQVRPADENQLARIRNVLESKFGVHGFEARTAQGTTTDQEMQPTFQPQMSPFPQSRPTAPTYMPPVVPEMPPLGATPGQQPMQPGAPGQQPMGGQPGGGTAGQAEFMETGSVTARRDSPPLWTVTYRDAGGVSSLPIEAASEVVARRIFASYDADAEVLQVKLAQEAPAAPAAPVPPVDAVPPGGAPPAAPGMGPPGMGGSMGGMPGMDPGMGATVTPEIQEVIRASMIALRNTGIDIASAIDEFQSQFKQWLDGYGDKTSPNRQQIAAELVKAAQEAWSKPTILQVQPKGNNQMGRMGAGARTPKSGPTSMPAPSRTRGDIPTPGQINTQQPDWVNLGTGSEVLGPDSQTQESTTNAIVPGGTIKTQPDTTGGGALSPTDLGPDSSTHDPGRFKAPKPPKDGRTTLVQNQSGTSLAPTDLGRDSQTGNNGATQRWDGVSSAAPGNMRSKPGGQGAPHVKGAMRIEATKHLAALPEEQLAGAASASEAAGWLVEAVRRARDLGEFPEEELWAARDAAVGAGNSETIPNIDPAAAKVWAYAVQAL